jgi:hypothetical protein
MIEKPEFEYIERRNRPVLALDDVHPAKRFLCAFIECRWNCVGRALGQYEAPIDQEWTSTTDGQRWTFSGFAYRILSFDIELDGFIQSAPYLTASEQEAEEQLPNMHLLMNECAQAARQSGNSDVIEPADQVLEMISLWEQYLSFRKEMISRTPGETGR